MSSLLTFALQGESLGGGEEAEKQGGSQDLVGTPLE